MCNHRTGGSLAVCTCHRNGIGIGRQYPQYLGTFIKPDTMLNKKLQFSIVFRYGRCINNNALNSVFYIFRNTSNVFKIMDVKAFVFQLTSEVISGFVVAMYIDAYGFKIAGYGTHANTTNTKK